MSKLGGEPNWIFVNPDVVSELLTENNIPDIHPQHDFYKQYILDKLKGSWFQSPKEMQEAVLKYVPKTASLSLRKKVFGQEGEPDFPSPQVTKQELIRLYTQEAKGIYDEELINAVVADFIRVLEECIISGGWSLKYEYESEEDKKSRTYRYEVDQIEDEKRLLQILRGAKTLQEKMIAIDRVINTMHKSGKYGDFLIKDFDDTFLDELGNLKISNLNFRKKLSVTENDTLQENFYEPEISDEYPKGPKSPKQRRFPFHNYPPDDQGNIINIDPNVSNPMEYDTTPGPNPQGPGIFGNLSMKKAESGIDRVLNELMELPFIIKTAEDIREFVNDVAGKMEISHHLVNGLILGHPDKFPESFTRNWISYVMDEYNIASFSKELATDVIYEAVGGKKKEPLTEEKEPELPSEISELTKIDPKVQNLLHTYTNEEIWDIASGRKTDVTEEEIEAAKYVITKGIVASRLSMRKKAGFIKPQVTKQELIRLYTQEAKGLYDVELMDEIISKFIIISESFREYHEQIHDSLSIDQDSKSFIADNISDAEEFIQILESAKTPQEKMIAIDRVINAMHSTGSYGEVFIIDFDESFLDELGNLKISSLNMRKKATSVSEPTPDDSLHEQQGEQESWHTYFQGDDRWKKREPGQGFDIPFPSKERIKRSPWPFDDTTPTSNTMASLNMKKGKGLKEYIREQIEKQFIIPQQLKLRFGKIAQIIELDVGDEVEFDTARYFRVGRHQSGGVLRGKGVVTEKNEDGSYNIEIQEVTEANENIAHIFKPGLITPFFPDEIKSVTPKFEPEEIPEEELKVKPPEMEIEEEEKEEVKPSDAAKGLMEWMPGILKPIFEEEEPEEKPKEKEEEEIEPEKPRWRSWKEFWKEWKEEAIKSLKRPVSKPFGSRLNMRESDIQKDLPLEDLSPKFKSGDEIKHKLMGEAVYKVVGYDPKTDEYLVIGGVEDRELKIDREELENRCETKLSMRKKAIIEEHEYKVHEGKVPTYTFIGYQEDPHGGETVMVNCDICGSTLMLIPEEIRTNINRIFKLPHDWERVVTAIKLSMKSVSKEDEIEENEEEEEEIEFPDPESDLVPQHMLYRLYKQEAKGIYDEELMDEIISKFVFTLKNMYDILVEEFGMGRQMREIKKLYQILEKPVSSKEKMIAIDQVIHNIHQTGKYGIYLIEGEESDIMHFLDELGNLKVSSLSMKKTAFDLQAQYAQPLTEDEKVFVLDFVQKFEIASDTEQIKEELKSDKFYIDLINHLENILNIPENRSNDLALAIWNRLQRDLYLFAQPESGFIEANLNSDMKFSAKYKGPIISILEDIAQDVWNAPDLETAKKIVLDKVEPSNIDEDDKQTIINNVNRINNLLELQKYIANSILFYEGMGTKLSMRKKASILDYPHKHLDTAMWDLSEDLPKLKENIKGLIIERFLNYLREEGKLNNPELWVTGFYYTGSTATQRYRPVSDIDIHVKVDWEKFRKSNPDKAKDSIEEIHKELLSVFWNTLNKETLPDTSHPLTYYVLSEKEDVFNQKEEAYDILNDSWIVPPQKMPENFDVEEKFELLREQAELIMERLDKALGEAKRNFIDYKILKELLDSYEGDKKDIEEIVKEKLEQVEKDLEKLQEENVKIHDERQKSFHDGEKPIEEGLSQNWAPGNIKFKMLERYRYMDVLRKIKHIIEDKKITEEEEEKLEDLLEPRLSMRKLSMTTEEKIKTVQKGIEEAEAEGNRDLVLELRKILNDLIVHSSNRKGSVPNPILKQLDYPHTWLPKKKKKDENKESSLNMRKRTLKFGQEEGEPNVPESPQVTKSQVTKQELIRLYKQEVQGIYDEELMDEIISEFIVSLQTWINYAAWSIKYAEFDNEQDEYDEYVIKEIEEKLVQILESAKTPQEKMIAIDQVIHTAHMGGVFGDRLIERFDRAFLNELGNIKVSSLSMRKEADLKNTILGLLLIGTTIPSIANVLGVPQNQIEQAIQESPEYFEEAKLQAVPGSEEFEIPEYKVTGTIYHAVPEQTSSDPEYTADMTKIDPENVPTAEGERIIALSRDLLKKFTSDAPFDYGDRVLVEGADEMNGIWVVHDTMHSRFINTIDFLVPEDMETGKWENIIIQKMQVPLAVLSMRKFAQYPPPSGVTKQELIRLYTQEAKGIYDVELMDEIISKWVYVMDVNMLTWDLPSIPDLLIDRLKEAKTPQEKMIAIDFVVHAFHEGLLIVDWIIEGGDKEFLDELGNLKISSLNMRKKAISDMEVPENYMVKDKTDKKLRRKNPPRHDKNDSIVEHNIDPRIDMASLSMRKANFRSKKEKDGVFYNKERKEGFEGQPLNYRGPSILEREDQGPDYPSGPAQAEIPGTADDDSWGESNKLKKRKPTKELIFPDFNIPYGAPGGEVKQL